MASSLLGGGGATGTAAAAAELRGRRRCSRPSCWALRRHDSFAGCSSSARSRQHQARASATDGEGASDSGDGNEEEDKEPKQPKAEANGPWADEARDRFERMVDTDEARFNGRALATIIRKKYGRSYDVQLIKREFMGRQLLAMNVMWKYREQRSFPLSEEEYLLRLDEVANTLRCWGAVSYIRRSIENTKERPRIGKAVSIIVDMDETGGRANEWIYR